VYVLRDEFDDGLNGRWETRGFQLQEGNLEGVLATVQDSDEPEEGDRYIISTKSGWRPKRRACVQMKGAFGFATVQSKLEFGFAHSNGSPNGCLWVSGTTDARNPHVPHFYLAVRDTINASRFDLAVASNNTLSVVDATPATAVSGNTNFTLLLATNEQGEARLWVNGIHDNSVVRAGTGNVGADLRIWLHLLNRLGGGVNLSVDYIQAWQERADMP